MKRRHVMLVVLAASIPGFVEEIALAQKQTGPLFSNGAQDYVMNDANDVYNDSVRKAVRLRAKGDWRGALEAFSNAAGKGVIIEYPNYKLWPDMADLYCKLGQKSAGVALLNEYRCAVEVLWGGRQCLAGDNNGDNPI